MSQKKRLLKDVHKRLRDWYEIREFCREGVGCFTDDEKRGLFTEYLCKLELARGVVDSKLTKGMPDRGDILQEISEEKAEIEAKLSETGC
jgi:hypothetical protein